MKEYFLYEICQMMSGGTPRRGVTGYYNGNIPWVKISDIENAVNGVINSTEELITQEGLDSINNRLFDKGTLLLAMYGSVGKVAIAGCQLSTNQAILGIKPKGNSLLHIPFLKYWIESKKQNLMNQSQGVALKNISATIVKRQKIRLPTLSEQKQIVKILNTADSLRQKRKEQLSLLDDYLKSVFFEMFGDPIQNDKNWKIYKFGNICPTRLGKMLDAKKQTGKNPKQYLRNQNVLWGRFKLNELAVMDFDLREQKEFRLIRGDVLICEGGEVGRTAIWNEDMKECYFQKALHRGRPYLKRILPIYIQHLMWIYSKYGGFKDYVSSVTIAHLTGEKLKSMLIPVPPIELQNKFASIVEQAEQTKQKMRASLDEMDNHFNALMQRYFG